MKVSPDHAGIDARYHQHTGGGITRRISATARRRVHDLFMKLVRPSPSDRVLDIGTSDDTGPDSNMLEQLYPHRSNLTCAGLTDGAPIAAAYPGIRYVRIERNRPLPFADNAFDIVYSNAVLEHVGSRAQQGRFIAEMCRVAPRRFLVVPNPSFPVEHHTCLPLVHYLPQKWFRALLRGTRYDVWTHEENLNYVTARDLRSLWPGAVGPEIVYTGIRLGPWSSNVAAYQEEES